MESNNYKLYIKAPLGIKDKKVVKNRKSWESVYKVVSYCLTKSKSENI